MHDTRKTHNIYHRYLKGWDINKSGFPNVPNSLSFIGVLIHSISFSNAQEVKFE
jgi:hypothetical protein